MPAWGKGGTARSCDALLRKVEQNDPRLTELVILSNKDFGSKEVERLAVAIENGRNTHLASVSASGHSLSVGSLMRLGAALARGGKSSAIKHLAIGNKDTGDDGVCALCDGLVSDDSNGGCQLESIDLSWKGIGPKGMQHIIQTLGALPMLTTLNLSRNEKIGTFTFPTDRFIALRELNISDCNLNDTCGLLEQQQQHHQGNHTIAVLRMNGNDFSATDKLSIHPSSSITELYLENCNIGNSGFQTLASSFSHAQNHSMKILSIADNGIGPAGLEFLTDNLKDMPQLEELNLANNPLDEGSVEKFGKVLGILKSDDSVAKSQLSKLDMTGAQCGIRGASSLIEHGKLQELRLFNNQLGNGFANQLQGALKGGHPTLSMLDVGGNGASDDEVAALLEALTMVDEDKPSFQNELKVLLVGGNKTGPRVEEMVKKVHAIFPDIDIARDKPKTEQQQQQQQQFPPGFPVHLLNQR